MSTILFENLSLVKPILDALNQQGYQNPTPVQEVAIPLVLKGKDILVTAQTGTGKTAAFALPILQKLGERPVPSGSKPNIRALILTPTRELAIQIEDSLKIYGRYMKSHVAVVIGGVSATPQIKALRKFPDILVATPGRLKDLHHQRFINLDKVEMLVLDEADRMLDMGFIADVRKIIDLLPKKRQTMFLSATLSPEISSLASDILTDPASVTITPPASVSINIEQKVFFVTQENKSDLLGELIEKENIRRALVFARTKHRAERIMKQLKNSGISADAIHSNKTQNARQRALSAFNRGSIKVLVGTDIIARGIDVDGISHVINYDIPNDPESYVHRIGRTARAGTTGIAMSFCDAAELSSLHSIEKLTKCHLTTLSDHPFHSTLIESLRDRRNPPKAAPGTFGRHMKARKRRF